MNTVTPLISLVTGCFNGQQFIERAFNSVLAQTYTNIELIFVNDGSTDNSLSKAKGFMELLKKKNISFVIIDQENQGYYPTAGIQKATGKYISTLDIDDYLMPESIEKRVMFLERNSEYAGVRTNGYEVNEHQLNDFTRLFVNDTLEKNNQYIFEDLLLGKTNNWAGSYMVRASVLFEHYPNHFVPGTRFGQNLQILMPVSYKRKIGFIDEPLMKYIRHSQSFTISNHTYENRIKQFQQFKEIRESILNLLEINSQDLIFNLKQTYLAIYLNTAYSFNRQEEFNSFYKQIAEKTISDKIRYHIINKNWIKEYFYRILNKLNHL